MDTKLNTVKGFFLTYYDIFVALKSHIKNQINVISRKNKKSFHLIMRL